MRVLVLSLVLLALVGSAMAACDSEPCNTGQSWYNAGAWRTNTLEKPVANGGKWTQHADAVTLGEGAYFKNRKDLDLTGVTLDGTSKNSFGRVHVVDIDNDGNNDILAGGGKSCWVYFNLGGGDFSGGAVDVGELTGSSNVRCFPIDVDGDGDMDLFQMGGGGYRRFVETVGRTFTGHASQKSYTSRHTDAHIEELSGDGHMDMIFTEGYAAWVASNPGVGPTWFDISAWKKMNYEWTAYIESWSVAYMMDWQYRGFAMTTSYGYEQHNGLKGRLDNSMYLSCSGADKCTHTAGGHFVSWFGRMHNNGYIRVADFNQDGHLDIALGSSLTPLYIGVRQSQIYGTGNAELITPRSVAEQYGYEKYGHEVGDVNNDGYPDIVWYSKQDKTDVRTFINNGADGMLQHATKNKHNQVDAWNVPTFTEYRQVIDGQSDMCTGGYNTCSWNIPEASANIGDIDGDGMADMVFGGQNALMWFKNGQLPTITMGTTASGKTVKCTDGDCQVLDAASGRFVSDDSVSADDITSEAPEASTSEWTEVPGTKKYSLTLNRDFGALPGDFSLTINQYLQGKLDAILANRMPGSSATINILSISAGSTVVEFNTQGDALNADAQADLEALSTYSDAAYVPDAGAAVDSVDSSSASFKMDADGNFQMRAADGTVTTSKSMCA